MTRRLAFAAASLAAASLFSSCSTVDKPAASVNGVDITFDELGELTTGYSEYLLVSGQTVDSLPKDVVSGTTARQLLTVRIRSIIEQQELAARGSEVTDADIDAKRTQFSEQFPDQWDQIAPAVQQFFAEQAATVDAFQKSFAPPEDEAQALYEQGVTASGVACVSHILVTTEDEAAEVIERLADGDDFATVATELSQDPGSGVNGGALTDAETGSPCTDATTFAGSYVPEFVDAAMNATVGEPTEAFASEFGFHVLLVRPFAEVADEALTAMGAALAGDRDDELVASADVSVSSSVGVWDAENKLVNTLDAVSIGAGA